MPVTFSFFGKKLKYQINLNGSSQICQNKTNPPIQNNAIFSDLKDRKDVLKKDILNCAFFRYVYFLLKIASKSVLSFNLLRPLYDPTKIKNFESCHSKWLQNLWKFLLKLHLFGNCYKSAYLAPRGITKTSSTYKYVATPLPLSHCR